MRTTVHEQPPLMGGYVSHRHGDELNEIDRILGERPELLVWVEEDLLRGGKNPQNGRPGMTAEQVLRVALAKQVLCVSYTKLVFHLKDSLSYGSFCRVGFFSEPLTKSSLQRNVKRLRAETLERINRTVLEVARERGVEAGRKVRIDSTVVETNIHAPTDSSLLYDAVRVMSRLMKRGQARFGVPGEWHTRRAKRRALDVLNAKDTASRVEAYRDLLLITRRTMRAAQEAADGLRHVQTAELLGEAIAAQMADELAQYADVTDTLVYQTEQRVLKGITVDQDAKVFSIFELHTDIIIKDRRDVQFGHKINLTSGKSGLFLDCFIEEGNPADSSVAPRMVQRQKDLYGRAPRQVALDGGYASKSNVSDIKGMGVKDVAIHKRRGISISEMTSSLSIFKALKKFRAGIEGGISFLKRCFGLDRCTWRGYLSFKSYVWASILSANLLTLARHQLGAPAES